MEIPGSGKGKGRGVEEENIFAIIAASGAKDTQDAHEDRIAFLEAVRAVSILSDNRIPPTQKLCQEVFKILRIGKSLELIMASYQLLTELDKAFPRVYFSNVDKLLSDNAKHELVVAKEAWLPFVVTTELSSSQREAGKDKGRPIDSYGFHLLIQDLVNMADETNFQQSDTMSLQNMLLFQYLVSVLESDFGPRNSSNEGTVNWTLLRESILNILLGSRKINYRNLVKDCLTIMSKLYEISVASSDDPMHLVNSVGQSDDDSKTAVTIALFEVANNTCIAMQKFLTMIMELDTFKKKAETEGCTTRADGVRTPIMELILDELTYNRDILHPFLQPSVRTRRSNGSADDTTFEEALKCFSNITTARSATKKIEAEIVQLLLVHGFQAYLSLPSKHSDEVISSPSEVKPSCSLIEICKNIISAFRTLRETNKDMEISAFAKEALFTAATIISLKSR